MSDDSDASTLLLFVAGALAATGGTAWIAFTVETAPLWPVAAVALAALAGVVSVLSRRREAALAAAGATLLAFAFLATGVETVGTRVAALVAALGVLTALETGDLLVRFADADPPPPAEVRRARAGTLARRLGLLALLVGVVALLPVLLGPHVTPPLLADSVELRNPWSVVVLGSIVLGLVLLAGAWRHRRDAQARAEDAGEEPA